MGIKTTFKAKEVLENRRLLIRIALRLLHSVEKPYYQHEWGERYAPRVRDSLDRLDKKLFVLSESFRFRHIADPAFTLRRIRRCTEILQLKVETLTDILDDEKPTLRDAYQEVKAFLENNPEVVIDFQPAETYLIFRTHDIFLENRDFGRYDIRLELSHLWRVGGEWSYSIIPRDRALAECPAEPEVCHPHVKNRKLCEGEAQTAIASAMANCQVSDFFYLIVDTLDSYDPTNAYAKLGEWDYVICIECGGSFHIDDMYSCTKCDEWVCPGDSAACRECCEVFCASHLTSCGKCIGPLCEDCADACYLCGREMCPSCADSYTCALCKRVICPECGDTCQSCGCLFCNHCSGNVDGRLLCLDCWEESESEEENPEPHIERRAQ